MPETAEQLEYERRAVQSAGTAFIDPRTSPRTPQEASDLLAVGGRQEWRDESIPLGQRAQSFLSAHAQAGTSDWRQIAAQAQQHFPGVDLTPAARGYEQQMNMVQARQRYRDWVPSTWDVAGRQMVPFVSAVFGAAERNWATDAQSRLEAGRAQPADYDILARSQRLNDLYERAGFPAEVSRTIAGLPAIAGEFAFAGGATSALGQAIGQAPRVAALTAAAPRTAAVAGFGGRTALTATAPSMWAPQAAENAASQGGNWYDLKNLGPAYATGFLNTAVLGSVARYGGTGALGLLQKVAIGVGEQAVADVATGFMDERLFGMKDARYGLVGDALQGRWGEVAKHATLQTITFALLGAMHHQWGKKNPVTESTRTLAEQSERQGLGPQGIAQRVAEAQAPVVEALKQNPNLPPEEARVAAETLPAGPQRRVAEALAQALPEKAPAKPEQAPRVESPITPKEAAAEEAKGPGRNVVAPRTRPEPPTVGHPTGLDANQRAFIENKVRQAGSLQNALVAYPRDTAVHNYAREYAKQLYGRQNAPEVAPGPPAPPEAARPPEVAQTPPGATREPFLGPLDVALTSLRAKLRGQGLSQGHVEAAVTAAREEGLHAPDMVTGYHKAETRGPTTERAIEHVRKTGEPGVYVEMDLANLGGVNAKLGNSGANEFFKKVADIVREEVGRLPADVHLFRHGGDEMSALAVNASREAVTDAMRRAHLRIKEAAAAFGLADIEHPKHPGVKEKRGTGITFGVADIGPKDSPRDIFGRADKEVEARKKSVEKAADQPAQSTGEVIQRTRRGRVEYSADGGKTWAVSEVAARMNAPPTIPRGAVTSPEVIGALVDSVADQLTPAQARRLKLVLTDPRPYEAIAAQLGVKRQAVEQMVNPLWKKLQAAEPRLAEYATLNDYRKALTEGGKTGRMEGLRTGGEVSKSGKVQAEGEWAEGTASGGMTPATDRDAVVNQVADHLDSPTPAAVPDVADLLTNLLAHARRQENPEAFLRREAPELVRDLPPEVVRRLVRVAQEFKHEAAKDAAHFDGDEAALRREVVGVLSEGAGDAATAALRPEAQAGGPGQAAQGPAQAPGAGQGNLPADAAAAAGRGEAGRDVLTPEERNEAHALAESHGVPAQTVEAALGEVKEDADLAARQQEAAAARTQAAQGTAAAQANRQSRLERLRAKQQPVATPGGFPAAPTPEQRRSGGIGGGQPDAGEAQLPQRETALANEVVNRERAARDLDHLMAEGVLPNQAVRDEALARLAADPEAGAKLVDDLTANMRPADAVELALLLQRRVSLHNERDVVNLQRNAEVANHVKARGDPKARAEIEAKLDGLEIQERALAAQLDQVDRVTNQTGTEAGRSLQFRQRMMAADYSLSGMTQRAERALGERLDPEQRQVVEDLHRRIKELQDQLNDMEGKGEVKPGAPSETGFRLAQARSKFDAHVEAWKRANAPLHVKAGRLIGEVTSAIPRSIMASVDFVLGRQGLLPFIMHPVVTAKAVPEMFKAFASEDAAQRAIYETESRPLYGLGKKAGLELTGKGGREEGYLSNLVEKFPVAGWLLKASERSAKAFLVRVRAGIFDTMVTNLAVDGKVTMPEARVIANSVNVFSGRGPLGFAEPAARLLAYTFFAPHWTVSRFQTLLGQPLYSNFSESAPRARKLVAMEYAKMVGAFGAFAGLATLFGADLEKDPRSSNFGKLRLGNTRIDFTGGLAGTARFLAQTATLSTKDQRGRVLPLSGRLPFGQDNWADVAARFTRGKLAPAPSAVFNLLSGSDVVGQPVTVQSQAASAFLPLFARDVYDAIQDLGVPKGTAVSLLGLLGLSITTYDSGRPRPPLPARRAPVSHR